MSFSPLSAFTAVPNPQMLAFMGAQSFVMMYQAGEGWQYGKRRISAMSNEEFNKLTPELVMEKQAVVLRDSLATIEKSMNDMTPMIGTIVKQYGDFIREIIKAIPEALQNATGTGLVPSTPEQYKTRAGTPAFITPITPYIPKFVTPSSKPSIPLSLPKTITPFGPQFKEVEEERKIQKDTRKKTPRGLGARQAELERAGRKIDDVARQINVSKKTEQMWQKKRKSGNLSLNAQYKSKAVAQSKIGNALIHVMLKLNNLYFKKYGSWYTPKVAIKFG